MRICNNCGIEFEPAGPRSRKCAACSIRKCKNCQNEVPADRTGVTCSAVCAHALRGRKLAIKVCEYPSCGHSFQPSSPSVKWCNEVHSMGCTVCGDTFIVKPAAAPPTTCAKCRKRKGDAQRKASKKKTFQERYGVDSAMEIPGQQEKIQAANLRKYGVNNQFQRSEVQEQMRRDSLELHGVEWAGQRPEVKAKIRETNLKNFGVPVPAQAPTVVEKMKATNIERYGVENVFETDAVKTKKVKSYREHYGADHPMQSQEYRKAFSKDFMRAHGVEWPILLPNVVPGRISKPNLRWRDALQNATGVAWELEHNFPGVGSMDLYADHGGVKVAIEINPTSTHNAYKHLIACNRRGCTEFPCTTHGKQRYYHQDRAKALKTKHAVELISVFDWMPEDRVLAFVRAKLRLNIKRVGARTCELRKLTQTEANKFLKNYHMMGSSTRQEFCYGLYFNGELVQVQTFAKRAHDWEARRLATKDGWQIIGGISKGTKAFIEEVAPEKIVAFADLNLSWPTFDSQFNGFAPETMVPPMLCWSKGTRMILDKSAARQSADRLLGIAKSSKESPYPESWSNVQVFVAEGWLPVWDCGMAKETWSV